MRRRTFAAAFLVAAGTGALLPQVAAAHGLVGRADLPIPTYLFTYGAAIVLFVSFLGLAVLWPEPRLQEPVEKELFRMPRWVGPVCGAIGVAVFVLVVVSGLAGTKTATDNFADTFIYVLFWVGLVVVSALFGDVFRAFNPWRAIARFAAYAGFAFGQPKAGPLPYPARLGRWPAVAGIAGFAWLELVYANKTDPELLALLAVGYAGVQLVGMGLYGIDTWSDRGDAFGVYFNLFSRISAFRLRAEDRMVMRRRVLAGLPPLDVLPGTTVLVCLMIGSTSFDGFSSTSTWTSIAPHLEDLFSSLGAGTTLSTELAGTVGLVCLVGLVGGFYRLGILGVHSVGGGFSTGELARRFAHTLVPIAMAYVIAHYFSLLIFQGQATWSLISDPLGKGSDFFGTAGTQIDYGVSGAVIWYVQVGALIAGHVAGLILAHDRALAIYDSPRRATRSQYWMLLIMIGFTSFALWLLASLNG